MARTHASCGAAAASILTRWAADHAIELAEQPRRWWGDRLLQGLERIRAARLAELLARRVARAPGRGGRSFLGEAPQDMQAFHGLQVQERMTSEGNIAWSARMAAGSISNLC